MGTGTIGKQSQLLFFYSVFHIGTSAVQPVVKLPIIAGDVGDDETGILLLCTDLQLGKDLPAFRPGSSVLEATDSLTCNDTPFPSVDALSAKKPILFR